MKRLFPLAGLLRLRHLQQDQASVELAAANTALRAHDERHLHARAALYGLSATPTNMAALSAMAAARASSRSMLGDLDALGRNHQTAVDAAQTVFDSARADSIRLEKLEVRHAEALAAEDLHAEQTVLDEIASTRWHRDQGGEPE
ncbi:hypothetical protein D6T64_11055 [Cryobacterium melibiosiphilum]|uniref:Flagellar FliJ protein n=1 Tax=Cryobacterium melibiosiphilum TaxID=995039 RepID=A0A3A5MGE6_9MICO|nr:hypothetical protein [Cryobacterium melibiosiphilum]RJT88185.1 hypothetical protein D6T64_11055 [Cryobacterium melibiosiphilum]